MAACLIGVGVSISLDLQIVFWLESALLWAFAFAWFVKGANLPGLKDSEGNAVSSSFFHFTSTVPGPCAMLSVHSPVHDSVNFDSIKKCQAWHPGGNRRGLLPEFAALALRYAPEDIHELKLTDMNQERGVNGRTILDTQSNPNSRRFGWLRAPKNHPSFEVLFFPEFGGNLQVGEINHRAAAFIAGLGVKPIYAALPRSTRSKS